MSWLMTSPGQTLGLVLIMAIGGLTIAWPLWGLVRDVWQLPMAIALRPRIATLATIIVGLSLFMLTGLVLGLDHIAGRLIIAAAFGARPALWLTQKIAWRTSDPEIRHSAADVRNELVKRLHQRPVSAARSWPAFIFDAERAARRARYEPPPI